MEQQCAASLAERQVAKLIQDDEISMGKAVGQSALIAVKFFLFQRASNKLRNHWTVGLLNLEPPHQVLEVGSGPGIALAQVAGCRTSGRIVGLDYWKTMHDMAANRNRQAIRDAGFQNIRVESLESLSAIMNGPKGCGR